MLGQPISMLLPQVVGFRLDGELPEGATATDLVLTVTEMLRERGVVSQVRRVLRPRPAHARARRPGDDRQHVAGVRLDLRDLPGRRRDAALPRVHRPPDRDDRARRRLRPRAGDVPRRRLRGPDLLRDARARPRRASSPTIAGPEAPAGPGRAARTRSRRSSSRWPSSTRRPPRSSATAATRRSRSPSPPPTRRPRTTTTSAASRARRPSRAATAVAAIAEREATRSRSTLEDGDRGRARPRPGRDRRDHQLHQHLEPVGDGRRRAARQEGGRAGPRRASRG